jgi:3-dehydroquinate dehydratase-2
MFPLRLPVLYTAPCEGFTRKAMAAKVLVLNGPNLNLLGEREPDIYGRETLADIDSACKKRGKSLGLQVTTKQSNIEGELVEQIQKARKTHDCIVINAGAYTHTSVAILDALKASALPVIEVHLSNIQRRESFRHHSYVAQAATGTIAGFGGYGYEMALEAAARLVGEKR